MKNMSINLLIDRSVRIKLVGVINELVTEALYYVFLAPKKWKGWLVKSGLNDTYSQAGIKMFNPFFVPNTPENTRMIKSVGSENQFSIYAYQRKDIVYIHFNTKSESYKWRYRVYEEDKNMMSNRFGLKFDKII